MGSSLKSLLDFLDSEKEVRAARRRAPALRSFAQPSSLPTHAVRFAQSYLIDTRSAVVERGNAQIWSVGDIFRADDAVNFKPSDNLAGEIRRGELRCGSTVKEFFGFELTPPESHNATELFSVIAANGLKKDPGLEKLRAGRGDEGAMQALWMIFGAAVHDQLCRRLPIELETIGIFVPVESDAMVRFIADEHLLNLIAGHATRGKFDIRSMRTVAPETQVRKPETSVKLQPSVVKGKPRSATWSFLDEERDLHPSDDRPLQGNDPRPRQRGQRILTTSTRA